MNHADYARLEELADLRLVGGCEQEYTTRRDQRFASEGWVTITPSARGVRVAITDNGLRRLNAEGVV